MSNYKYLLLTREICDFVQLFISGDEESKLFVSTTWMDDKYHQRMFSPIITTCIFFLFFSDLLLYLKLMKQMCATTALLLVSSAITCMEQFLFAIMLCS